MYMYLYSANLCMHNIHLPVMLKHSPSKSDDTRGGRTWRNEIAQKDAIKKSTVSLGQWKL